ncbi:TIGR03435 family protein [Granulicella sibirica]|uniref:CHP03435 domain-containing protein n=1 Tax=Granulicella sibirica TaxID=2479048 RepID=A0A4Q0T5W8_9BACT|nr:TIGR03435 family protein [Granulicella sibirica]RXH56971.1 CHP03435 domain-containing protein [Granulicella sibirica]
MALDLRQIMLGSFLALSLSGLAQAPEEKPVENAFEVATVKPVASDKQSGRYIKMDGDHRFVEKDYTLKLLIAAAYDISPKTISGGPSWVDSEHYDILALTPGDGRPSRDQQMAMLRTLLTERFKLGFHREEKEFAIYVLGVAKSGPKMKPSTGDPGAPAALVSTVYPNKVTLPARNASMPEFASLLRRAVMDRPVVDKTGLAGKFDFDLSWAPDDTQFGGDMPPMPADVAVPPLFVAMQEQLGLTLLATHGPLQALVIDQAEKPSAN